MPIFISCSKALARACWGREKLGSIAAEATKKRIKCYFVSSRTELVAHEKAYLAEPSSLVIIPGSERELLDCRAEFAGLPLHVIVFAHHFHDMFESEFSYVMSDLSDAMQCAIRHLQSRKCTSPALFAVGRQSYHDRCREETFRRFSGTETPRVFHSAGRLQETTKALLQTHEPIDALLCVNDLFALALMPLLSALDPEWNRKMLLLGFSDTIVGALHRPSLTSLTLGYAAGGREVVHIHRSIPKNEQLACMHAVMKSVLVARDTTEADAPCGICFADYPKLSDNQLTALLGSYNDLMHLENLLHTCDSIDYRLIAALLEGSSQGEAAEQLFLTTDSIKYRVRKMRRLLGCESSQALTAFLRTWIDKTHLENRMKTILTDE